MATVMRRTSSIGVVAVVVAVVFAALTSCSADSSDRSGSETSASDSTPTPTLAATPSPSPTGPCANGTCQIQVAVGDLVAVPERYGLGPIKVAAITATDVEMVAPLTGTSYSVSGCAGGGTTSSQGGGIGVRCKVGNVATINDAMNLEVVKIGATVAVLRIKPAA